MSIKMTIRSPEDFIAYTPIALGFEPEQSVVMITVGKFCARVDLPTNDQEADLLAKTLLEPSLKNNVKQAAFLFFSELDRQDYLRKLVDEFNNARIAVVAALEVRDDKYRELGTDEWLLSNVESNAITLDVKFHGLLKPRMSREDVRVSIQPRGGQMTIDELVGVRLLNAPGVNSLLLSMKRETAKTDVVFWTRVLSKTTLGSQQQKDAAIALAFAAWLSGDGALSWIALDLAGEDHRTYPSIARLLQEGRDPAGWPDE